MRSFLSFVLALVGLAAVAVAIPATWARHHLMDTGRYTSVVAPLIHEPEVRDGVSSALTRALTRDADLPDAVVAVVRKAADEAVATDTFAQVWTDAVRISHAQLVEAARDEGTGLSADEAGLRVDLAPLGESLRWRMADAGVPFVDRLPEVEGSFVLADSTEAAEAIRVAGVVDRWADPLALVGIVLLGVAALFSVRPGRTLVVVGLAVAAIAGAYAVGWASLDLVAGSVERGSSVAQLVVEALSASVHPWLAAFGGAGLMAVLMGLLLLGVGRRRPRVDG